jgi:nitronate monooxygenase
MKATRRDFIGTGVVAGVVGLTRPSAADTGQVEPKITIPTERSKALMAPFGLKYPIFEAPHGAATSPELAIAVSNAGAMGALASLGDAEHARRAVSQVRAGTKGSFLVNFILALVPSSGNKATSGYDVKSLKAALDAGAPVVQFSWGIPTPETISAIRATNAKVGIQVTNKESARAALDLGADYLVCQGTEAGGHVQGTRGLYEALPIVLEEAKDTPVVASGGIGDGHAIRKALVAGASAVMLGTRFVATAESNAHPAYKQAMIAAHLQDTALTVCFQDGWSATHRALRNRTLVLWEGAGCPSPGKRPGEGDVVATRSDGSKVLRYQLWSPLRSFDGTVTDCALYAGQSVEFVKDLPSAGELVERLWRECVAG